MNHNFQLIKKYMDVDGISRHEEAVANTFKKNVKKYNVEFLRDGLGSIIAHFPQAKKGPKILLTGHLDEIGYMVLDINDNGQIKVSSVGGIWPTAVVGSKIKLITSSEKNYFGVLGHTSVHILPVEKRKIAISEEELFADFGFLSKKEAQDAGVEIGDQIYLQSEAFELKNNMMAGKAIDNRISVAIMEQLIINLHKTEFVNQPYFAGTVQEEVGCRGARTTSAMIAPQVAIAIDTCASHDTVGAIPGVTKVNEGVAIAIKDHGTLTDTKLINYVMGLAKKHKIKAYKYIAQGGGTDALNLQYGGNGVATIIISMPQRYLHSSYGMVSLNDFQSALDLLTEFLKSFGSKEYDAISYK